MMTAACTDMASLVIMTEKLPCRYFDWPARSENILFYFQGMASQATSTLGEPEYLHTMCLTVCRRCLSVCRSCLSMFRQNKPVFGSHAV